MAGCLIGLKPAQWERINVQYSKPSQLTMSGEVMEPRGEPTLATF